MTAEHGTPVPQAGPVGIIDIGSNSIRLVVFEGIQRNPVPLYNEKALCGIGRNMVTTGELDQDGLRRARRALRRFRAIADSFGIGTLQAAATAAARDATNGEAFVAEAEALIRSPVQLLSGAEEAAYAADGVVAGIPNADGLVGDLGGGSLELAELVRGTRGPATTLALGPLRLMDLAGGKIGVATRLVDDALAQVPWLKALKGRPLYAVGGVWRTIARLHMAQRNYPLHVLHNYMIGADDAVGIGHLIATQGKKSLQTLKDIPRHRQETVPYGALVLERLIATVGLSGVVLSAFGLREGLLFSLLPPDEQQKDPLIEAARSYARNYGRSPDHVEELASWIVPLFPDQDDAGRRLSHAACLFSDFAWRAHPDYRADHAYMGILTSPFVGVDHSERAALALAIFHRYAGDADAERSKLLRPVLRPEEAQHARAIGLALRLGHTLAGSRPGILPRCALSLRENAVVLALASADADLVGESVQKRLATLAGALGREPEVDVV